MKTIEEKAKAYDEAIERAKDFINGEVHYPLNEGENIMCWIFPELKEGEEEKIRKWLLDFVQGLPDEGLDFHFYNLNKEQVVAWLEKPCDKVIDCPQNHQDSSHPNGCIVLEDFNGGEGFYKLNLDYLNKKQVEEVEEMVKIWNKESSNENIKDCIGMCLTDVNEQRFKDYNTNLKECLAWLEKQGKTIDTLTPQKAMDIAVAKCFNEQKAVDKVESKFNVGDWIVFAENHNSIYQVERIDNYRYYLRHYLGGTLSLHFDTELIRLWTIQDARDGDVLVSNDDGRPFIFKGCLDSNHPNCPVAYCGIDTRDMFHIGSNCWWADKKCHPANKEQCELLFKKIKEAGYTWNPDERKLNKIENHADLSEEDAFRTRTLIDVVKSGASIRPELRNEFVVWLESLRQRVKGE